MVKPSTRPNLGFDILLTALYDPVNPYSATLNFVLIILSSLKLVNHSNTDQPHQFSIESISCLSPTTLGVYGLIHQTHPQHLESIHQGPKTVQVKPLPHSDTRTMRHTDDARKLANQLGLLRLFELGPSQFEAAIMATQALVENQPSPTALHQEPAHVCYFTRQTSNLIHQQ